jgi:hypothetical protein
MDLKTFIEGIKIETTHKRGFTPEELASRAADKIISIGDQTHPAIREQARAFKQHIAVVIAFYLKEAVIQDRVTIANRLRDAGYPDLVSILEK